MMLKGGKRWALSMVACVLLAGCASEVATVTAQTPAGNSRTTSLESFQSLLNSERASAGLRPVSRSGKLTSAAFAHANNMSAKGYFSHVSPAGSSLRKRVRAQGYGFCALSENIAKGQKSSAEVFGLWMRSPGHRRNILNPRVTEFGMSRAPGNYWVLVLGRPGC